MAKLFSDQTGVVIRFSEDQNDETIYGTPSQFAYYLEFDPATNQNTFISIHLSTDNVRLIGSSLTIDGQPVVINPHGEEWNANEAIKTGYPVLPDWVKTATAADVSAYVTNNVWQGYTKAQVNAWIDANITGTTVVQLRTQIIAALKLVAGAIIDLRDLMAIEARLIVYLRDLVLRFRK